VDEVGWSILLICLLAIGSGFFSVNNMSLRSFSRVKLQDVLKQANREHVFDKLIDNSEKFMMTCSIFAVLSNAAILFILLTVFKDVGLFVNLVIAVLILGISSVAIPHSWAKYASHSVLQTSYPILVLFSYIASPLIYFLKLHDRFVRRMAGVQEVPPDQQQEEKQEELLSVFEQGKIEGVVDEEEMEMIENVLELSDTTAEEIMTPRTDLIAVDAGQDLQSLVNTIAEAGHSRIPVYEDNIDNIIGLIYAKDLLSEIGKNPEEYKLREKMRQAYFVPESKPLRVLLHEFQNQKLHIAVVLDEYGGTAGIVTIEDILEELVGEIVDEYEETPPEAIQRIDDNTIELDARVYIDDLNEDFELNLPEDEDYDTVGGFVFAHLGYIPKTGETFEYEKIVFKVLSAEARRINRIRIVVPSTGQGPKE
jgi:CBS domain containing-hemolysin-like protein